MGTIVVVKNEYFLLSYPQPFVINDHLLNNWKVFT